MVQDERSPFANRATPPPRAGRESAGARLTKILHWTRGEHALAEAVAASGDLPRPFSALEAMESLAGLLAVTSDAHFEQARRLAPDAREGPVPLIAGARSLRFYLPVQPRTGFEVEATVIPEQGELVVIAVESRLTSGERVAKGELRFLLVPGAGEHAATSRAQQALREGLGYAGW
ncbi:hypothetical protein HY251_18620 [bacterium]|nr:hypothetical protein [bacterium]